MTIDKFMLRGWNFQSFVVKCELPHEAYAIKVPNKLLGSWKLNKVKQNEITPDTKS